MGELLDKFLAIPVAQKALLAAILMAGVGIGWYYLSAAATNDAITKENARTSALGTRKHDAELLEKEMKGIEAAIKKLTQKLEETQGRLPQDAEIGELLLKIHGQAKIVGLEISRFEREESQTESLYIRIPVKMTLMGTFHQINTFFYYVGKLTRLVNVENIELTVFEREQDNAKLQAECTATTFMYRPPPKPGGGR